MSNAIEINELHWLLAVTQNIDVGIVVLDLNYRVTVWNTFMENRSGVVPYVAVDKTFSRFFRRSTRSGSARKSTMS